MSEQVFKWSAVKKLLADAWDEGYETGTQDEHAFNAVTEGYVDFDDYEDTPNPYQDN